MVDYPLRSFLSSVSPKRSTQDEMITWQHADYQGQPDLKAGGLVEPG